MKALMCFSVMVLCLLIALEFSNAWSGNYEKVKRARRELRSYCTYWYWWGCSWWRTRWYTVYYYSYQCMPGWIHNGDENCTIPICRPSCKNGGICEEPNVCNCPNGTSGPTTACSTLLELSTLTSQDTSSAVPTEIP